VGARAEEHRGALSLSHPICHGVIDNWGDMERLWAHVYEQPAGAGFRANADEHAVSSAAVVWQV
jgi:centractin